MCDTSSASSSSSDKCFSSAASAVLQQLEYNRRHLLLSSPKLPAHCHLLLWFVIKARRHSKCGCFSQSLPFLFFLLLHFFSHTDRFADSKSIKMADYRRKDKFPKSGGQKEFEKKSTGKKSTTTAAATSSSDEPPPSTSAPGIF